MPVQPLGPPESKLAEVLAQQAEPPPPPEDRPATLSIPLWLAIAMGATLLVNTALLVIMMLSSKPAPGSEPLPPDILSEMRKDIQSLKSQHEQQVKEIGQIVVSQEKLTQQFNKPAIVPPVPDIGKLESQVAAMLTVTQKLAEEQQKLDRKLDALVMQLGQTSGKVTTLEKKMLATEERGSGLEKSLRETRVLIEFIAKHISSPGRAINP